MKTKPLRLRVQSNIFGNYRAMQGNQEFAMAGSLYDVVSLVMDKVSNFDLDNQKAAPPMPEFYGPLGELAKARWNELCAVLWPSS